MDSQDMAEFWEQQFRKMAKYFLDQIEGDCLYTEEAYELMKEFGIVDEEGFEL